MQKAMKYRLRRWAFCTLESFSYGMRSKCAYLSELLPPEKPHPLSAYLCGIVKNISLNKYHANIAGKRNRHYDLVLDELAECLAGTATVEDTILAQELGREINVFLAGLKKTDRIIFVRRYWFLEDVREIADSLGKTSNYVAVHLHRSRSRLKKYLIGKGLME